MIRQKTPGVEHRSALEPADASRRRFLKVAAASGLAFPWAVSTAHALGPVDSDEDQPLGPLWEIEAVRVVQTFADGTTLPYFRFRPLGTTPSAGGVPVLTGNAGEVARLRVRNTLSRTIRPTIVGGAPSASIAPGAEVIFDVIVPSEGTWLLTDAALGDAAGPMGLGAVIVSRPTGFAFRRRIPSYDREYVLLYVDSDDRWNRAIDAGTTPNYTLYEPNYHTVNSLTYPDTASDPGTAITCRAGDNVLLRMCNLGWVRHSIHFHGYHVQMQRVNNQHQSIYGLKDTVPLPGHTTMEALLSVNQTGVFPVHPHSLTATTDNGLYVAGQLTLIKAT
jgi:FtsP/CotA-like multicopper oxidase with cupredoxin domain